MTLSPEVLNAILAVALGLSLEYIPYLDQAWASLQTKTKKQFILIFLAVITAAIYGMSCAGWMDVLLPEAVMVCGGSTGILLAIRSFGIAVLASQGFHSLLKRENPDDRPPVR